MFEKSREIVTFRLVRGTKSQQKNLKRILAMKCSRSELLRAMRHGSSYGCGVETKSQWVDQLSWTSVLKIAKHAYDSSTLNAHNKWSDGGKHFRFVWNHSGLSPFYFNPFNIYDNIICLFSGTTVVRELTQTDADRRVSSPGRWTNTFSHVSRRISLRNVYVRITCLRITTTTTRVSDFC